MGMVKNTWGLPMQITSNNHTKNTAVMTTMSRAIMRRAVTTGRAMMSGWQMRCILPIFIIFIVIFTDPPPLPTSITMAMTRVMTGRDDGEDDNDNDVYTADEVHPTLYYYFYCNFYRTPSPPASPWQQQSNNWQG